MECGLIVGETTISLDLVDRPLLQISDGQTIEVIFTRTTDMRHVDECFRGPKTSFEDDMCEGSGECVRVGISLGFAGHLPARRCEYDAKKG